MMENKWGLIALLVAVLFVVYGVYMFTMDKENMADIDMPKVEKNMTDKDMKSAMKELPTTVEDTQKTYLENGYEDPGQFLLTDGDDHEVRTTGNLCSFNCCSQGWGMPKTNDGVDDASKYVKNNMFCSNSTQGTGCMCLTKKQADNISTRGNNI